MCGLPSLILGRGVRKEKVYEFDVVILEDETGGYVALVPSLPGCHSQGDTIEEVLENIREAIELYLDMSSRVSGLSLLSRQSRSSLSTSSRPMYTS